MKKQWMIMGLAGLLVTSAVAGDVPLKFNYQGVLKTGDGDAVSSQTKAVTFRLYDVTTAGTAHWGRQIAIRTDAEGLFNVELSDDVGSTISALTNSLPEALLNHSDLFLELEVDGHAILPRQQLLSVPFAMLAGDVKNASAGFAVAGELTVSSGAQVASLTVIEDAELQGNLKVGDEIRFNRTGDYDLWIQGASEEYVDPSDLRNLSLVGTAQDNTDTLYVNFESEYKGGTVIGGPVSFGNSPAGTYPLHSPIAGLRITCAHVAADGTCTSPAGSGVTSKRSDVGEYEVHFPAYDTFPFVSVSTSMDQGLWDEAARNNFAVSDYLLVDRVEIDTRDASGFFEDTPFDIIIVGVDATP